MQAGLEKRKEYMFSTIIFERDDKVARITLNRPDAMNAVNEQMLLELNQALDKIEMEEPFVRLVVLTGKGKGFCAGRDLKENRAKPPEKRKDWQKWLGPRTLYRIENLGQPVIAGVHGFALAGGLEIAMCCDIVIVADNAQIGDQHANWGMVPGGWGGSQRLLRQLGFRKAKQYVLTGDRIPIDEAVRSGLVNMSVPADKLNGAVEDMVQKLITKNAMALKAGKAMINRGSQTDLYTSLELEHYMGLPVIASQETKEGLAAFVEKRKPDFDAAKK